MFRSNVTVLIVGALSLALSTSSPGQDKPTSNPTSSPTKTSKAPYTLPSCIVSGEALGSMGDPIVYEHEGREVRFCCKGCIEKFEKEPAKYLQAMDAAIIEQQLPYYPGTTCVVSSEPLSEDGSKPVDWVYQNRLVRLCCKMCKQDFLKDPEKYLLKLDKAIVEQQGAKYPLETCVVSSEKLGSMGETVDLVVGNRLLRLCCKGCKKTALANPQKYLAKLDEKRTGDDQGKKDDHGEHKKPDHGKHEH